LHHIVEGKRLFREKLATLGIDRKFSISFPLGESL